MILNTIKIIQCYHNFVHASLDECFCNRMDNKKSEMDQSSIRFEQFVFFSGSIKFELSG